MIKKEQKSVFPNSEELNLLIFGDNIAGLNKLLKHYSLRGKVDLVYIDPPFATNSHFTIGKSRVSTMSKSNQDPIAYTDKLLGDDFLKFLRDRLILLKELMAPHGSIYLHIDYKIGHYVKILMDEVFGIKNFRNDITRIKCNPKNFERKAYGNIKDLILFYSKTDNYTWNSPKIDFSDDDYERLFKKVDKDGRHYTTIPLHAPGETVNGETGRAWRHLMPPVGRHWRSKPSVLEGWDYQGLIEWSTKGVPRKKIYADERTGKKAQDIWNFKDPQNPTYPTEKNLDLLKFILEASSTKGDLVLDCFSGSGTTLLAAQQLERRWIGIDGSKHAIEATQKRLHKNKPTLFEQKDYKLVEL